MTVLKINCDDEALARELADLVLAFARSRGLGVEHHWLKGRMSLRRGAPDDLSDGNCAGASATVIAFPLARAVSRRA